MRARTTVLVIGAGVSGLTTALCLAERGIPVRLQARDGPQATTSCAASAMWGPYSAEHPDLTRWSLASLARFADLTGRDGTGVRMVDGQEASRVPVTPPDWATLVPGYRMCQAGELPAGFVCGWSYPIPVIDMPVYLDHLVRELSDFGCAVERADVGDLSEAVRAAGIVVNCTGAGAGTLVPDPDLRPERGQLVVVDNPGIDRCFADHGEDGDAGELTYFVPHGDTVVLGGSAEPGRHDREPDRAVSAAILRRCAAIEPRLAGLPIRAERVGLRPIRPKVRLEHVPDGAGHVIHNYGHGGAGVTLSWGCAGDVADIVSDL